MRVAQQWNETSPASSQWLSHRCRETVARCRCLTLRSAEIMSKIFQPFFTTKGGKGQPRNPFQASWLDSGKKHHGKDAQYLLQHFLADQSRRPQLPLRSNDSESSSANPLMYRVGDRRMAMRYWNCSEQFNISPAGPLDSAVPVRISRSRATELIATQAGMAELADAADSKSAGLRPLGVRLPLPAPASKPRRTRASAHKSHQKS